eukprot:TRINITY_DN7279_c0_g1_i3.p1 TRINITY_DN7279_c0_g1~~TRINITY_DN7279_c0_g1_i3.p1  ORF type:complete len:138 (+),score=42.85 TRINITY_DN7279_c0_g1_i3:881-1294(+)
MLIKEHHSTFKLLHTISEEVTELNAIGKCSYLALPNFDRFLTSTHRRIKMWDSSGNLIAQWHGILAPMAFCHSEKLLFLLNSQFDETIQVRDAISGKLKREISLKRVRGVTSMIYSEDLHLILLGTSSGKIIQISFQ